MAHLLLGENNVGVWLNESLCGTVEAEFDFPYNHAFDNERTFLRQWLEQELDNFDSPVSFVERFVNLDEQGKLELILGGHLIEIEQVMRWALMCEPLPWLNGGIWILLLKSSTLTYKNPEYFVLIGKGAGDIEKPEKEVPLTFQMSCYMSEHYIPEVTKIIRQEHRCIRRPQDWDFSQIQVEVETPTAHEQLEAALQLRNWLRENQAPPEIEALLSL